MGRGLSSLPRQRWGAEGSPGLIAPFWKPVVSEVQKWTLPFSNDDGCYSCANKTALGNRSMRKVSVGELSIKWAIDCCAGKAPALCQADLGRASLFFVAEFSQSFSTISSPLRHQRHYPAEKEKTTYAWGVSSLIWTPTVLAVCLSLWVFGSLSFGLSDPPEALFLLRSFPSGGVNKSLLFLAVHFHKTCRNLLTLG